MSAAAKRLLELFRGREDAFAEHGSTWHPVRRPLTIDDLEAHVRGERVLGVYLVRPDETVSFGTGDFDDEEDPDSCRALGERLRDQLVTMGIPLEATLRNFSGGKGYHTHLFVEKPVSAAIMRRTLDIASVLAELPEHEIFPKQDKVDDLGNLIKLPLAVHPKTKKQASILDNHRVRPCDPAILHHIVREHAKVQRRATADKKTEPPKAEYTVGARHDRLIEIAGKANSEGWSLEAAELAALAENRYRFDPPLGEDEVCKHVRQIYQRYADEHRSGPEKRGGKIIHGTSATQEEVELGEVPAFPLGVLPRPARALVKTAEEAGLPPALAVGAALAALAVAVGPEAEIGLASVGSTQRPVLWVPLIAPRGAGKSPCQDLAFKPIRDQDAELGPAYRATPSSLECRDGERNGPGDFKAQPWYVPW